MWVFFCLDGTKPEPVQPNNHIDPISFTKTTPRGRFLPYPAILAYPTQLPALKRILVQLKRGSSNRVTCPSRKGNRECHLFAQNSPSQTFSRQRRLMTRLTRQGPAEGHLVQIRLHYRSIYYKSTRARARYKVLDL